MRINPAALALPLALALCSCTGPTHEQQHAHNEAKLAAEGLVALKVGAAAPALKLSGTGGASLALPLAAPPADPAGGWTALYFFPAPNTPNSAKNLTQLSAQAGTLAQSGITCYGVSNAPLAGLEAFAATLRSKVPLLSNPDGSACWAYGALKVGGRYPQRTTVLVSPEGRIALFKRGFVLPAELTKAAGHGAAVDAAQ